MKRLLSTNISATSTSFSLLLIRIVFGSAMIIGHGYKKLANFSEIAPKFMDFMGLGSGTSLALAIFAEFFCSIAIILGLFTRLALLPLIVTAFVIVFMANDGDVFGKAELGFLYFTAYTVLLIVGAGRFSVDALISRK